MTNGVSQVKEGIEPNPGQMLPMYILLSLAIVGPLMVPSWSSCCRQEKTVRENENNAIISESNAFFKTKVEDVVRGGSIGSEYFRHIRKVISEVGTKAKT